MDITQQSTRTHMAAFPPADGKGKWHAANQITGTSYCGNGRQSVILDTTAAPIIATRGSKAHAFVCKRCLSWTSAT